MQSKRRQSKSLNRKGSHKGGSRKVSQSAGAIINMGADWKSLVLPSLPETITCPVCNEKHDKKNLIYDVNSLRPWFRKRFPNGIRVRSFKAPSRRIFLRFDIFTGTIFYFACHECNFMFIFRNQRPENKKDVKPANKRSIKGK